MATSPNFPRGMGPVLINGVIPALRLGNSATVITGAASANMALPLDPNGNLYAAYLVQCLIAACWWDFVTSGADSVVAAAANSQPAQAGVDLIVVTPPGATNIAAIQQSAAGTLTFTGIF